jgi:hypothetical protein
MAEVLGIVASGISVVQIAGQLVKCVQQLRNVCRSIRDFPAELQQILQEIQVLGEVFCNLENLQGDYSPVGSFDVLKASLAHCVVAKTALEAIISRTRSPQNARTGKQNWYTIKAVFKKEEIKELKQRLEDSKSLLQLAMSCHSL